MRTNILIFLSQKISNQRIQQKHIFQKTTQSENALQKQLINKTF